MAQTDFSSDYTLFPVEERGMLDFVHPLRIDDAPQLQSLSQLLPLLVWVNWLRLLLHSKKTQQVIASRSDWGQIAFQVFVEGLYCHRFAFWHCTDTQPEPLYDLWSDSLVSAEMNSS